MSERLILGCGIHHQKLPGEFLVDRLEAPGIDLVHDLDVTPWPLEDGRFLHASAIHLVEHLRSLVAFMDECWRVLEVGGSLYLETPLAGGDPDLEFADPTHVRCYRPHTFVNYFTPEGIERFGYTGRPWMFAHILGPGGLRPGILTVHGFPIKR